MFAALREDLHMKICPNVDGILCIGALRYDLHIKIIPFLFCVMLLFNSKNNSDPLKEIVITEKKLSFSLVNIQTVSHNSYHIQQQAIKCDIPGTRFF